MTNRATRACLECGGPTNELYKQTCSDSCRMARRRRQGREHDAARRPLTSRTVSCKTCGVMFEVVGPGPRAYCDAHRRYELHRGKRQYNPGGSRKASLKYQYGLTPEAWQSMLDAQGGCCATPGCGKAENLHVDHDHACCPGSRSCGQCVRGLLCAGCNKAAGLLRDDPDLIRGLAWYIENPRTANLRSAA